MVRNHEGWERMQRVGSRQHGLVTTRQLLAGGLTRAQVTWRLNRRDLVPVWRGLYRFPATRVSWEQRALAVLLRLGPGAALSHRTAASVLRLDGFEARPPTLEAVLPMGRRAERIPGVTVHRTRRRIESVTIGGLRVTDTARTLIDLAGQLRGDQLDDALDSAHRERPGIDGEVERCLEGRSRGVGGARALKGLVDERAGQHTDSKLEARVFRALRRARLLRPVHQYHVTDEGGLIMRVDFAWPQHKVALHSDGYRTHRARQQFERDRSTATRLTAAGWRSCWVTWSQVDQPRWLDDLCLTLAAAAPQQRLALGLPAPPPRNK